MKVLEPQTARLVMKALDPKNEKIAAVAAPYLLNDATDDLIAEGRQLHECTRRQLAILGRYAKMCALRALKSRELPLLITHIP